MPSEEAVKKARTCEIKWALIVVETVVVVVPVVDVFGQVHLFSGPKGRLGFLVRLPNLIRTCQIEGSTTVAGAQKWEKMRKRTKGLLAGLNLRSMRLTLMENGIDVDDEIDRMRIVRCRK
jgi:hypothetical protein